MRRKSLARISHAVTPFVLLAMLFLGGLYYVLLSTMTRVVAEDADLAAQQLSMYLVGHPEEMTQLLAGQDFTADGARFFSIYSQGQSIVGFRLFDAKGIAVSKVVMPHLEDGRPRKEKSDGKLSKSTVSLSAPGRARLDLVVLSNQKGREKIVQEELLSSFIALTFLTICSFGVPAFVFLRELAQRERGEERMEFLAQHDIMTSLMNRTAFNAALERQLLDAEGYLTALHFIDLDRFKSVNDSLGHDVGDELIKTVAERLQSLAGPDDFVARFGGDEFVMAQTRLASPQDAEFRAARIKDAMSVPMTVGEHRVKTTASIGVAIAPRDGANLPLLTRAADLAVYSAKAEGRDAWKMYDSAMDAALQQRQRIERALLHAVAELSFELYYQPIVSSDDKSLLGYEVLLRLQSVEGEAFQPTDFIPIAEEMGLISEIGAFVLRKACLSAVTWPDGLIVAVNLSPQQFESGELPGIVQGSLTASGLSPKRLELEITEGLLLSDNERVIAQLHELKALGVSIAMDDFGTGYSSLSYLWRFPFDKLKIDRSFMRVLSENDENIASILKTIVSLGRTLNLRVTAEGVETEEQFRVLKMLKCDQLQGYHFGRPMPEIDLPASILEFMRPKVDLPVDSTTKTNAA